LAAALAGIERDRRAHQHERPASAQGTFPARLHRVIAHTRARYALAGGFVKRRHDDVNAAAKRFCSVELPGVFAASFHVFNARSSSAKSQGIHLKFL
jgi:hypothetical protein